jgi:DnaJ-class molecular chaperone
MSFIVHPCTTCRGTGSLTIGADYERRGNLYRNEEVCPTCDGEGAVFEYDGESDAHTPGPR